MPNLHTYASVRLLRQYLMGEDDGVDWTKETETLRTLVESASRRVTEAMGGNWFGPITQTREYDLGSGSLRNSAGIPGNKPQLIDGLNVGASGLIDLGAWLVSATTVTAYTDTARTGNTVLTEGIGNDYLLEPYNSDPKRYLKLEEDTANSLSGGQKTLTIAGTWGWMNKPREVTTLAEAINDSVTDPQITNVRELSPGQVILVGSEQMYVRDVSGPDAIVERGHNGTTAASHLISAAVSVYDYPGDVVEATLAIARNQWRERHAGTTDFEGPADASMTRPGAEIKAILRGLNWYKGQLQHGGVFV